MKRQVFFSFEYNKDVWRASMVRNMGKVDKSSTFSDNDWEEVKSKSDATIRAWIDKELSMRSCVVVLIGTTTSTRKWVQYEIKRAYELHKGIVGIYIDRLEDCRGQQAECGLNPFNRIYAKDGYPLSHYVETFKTIYLSSQYAYNDIRDNLEDLIEDAIKKSGTY